MIVLKFGGTSVGKPERLKKVADLVLTTPGKKIVVLSALSGTTNALVSIGENLLAGNLDKAESEIAALERHYHAYIGDLFTGEASLAIGQEIVGRYFILLRLLAAGQFDDKSYRELLAQGHRPWLRIRLGVIDRDLDLEVAEVRAPDSLAQPAGARNHAARPIEPHVVPKSNRVDHQRVVGPRGR